jgi:membrane protease YdiL (CAAX protease family)
VAWSFRWVDLRYALIATVSMQGFSLLVGAILTIMGVVSASTPSLGNTSAFTSSGGVWMWLLPVLAAVGSPLVEEIFFRGLFLGIAVQRFPKWVAVLMSSLAFGLLHMQSSLWSSVFMVTTTTLVGCVFAVMRLRTGRLGTSITAHIMFNSATLLLAVLGAS